MDHVLYVIGAVLALLWLLKSLAPRPEEFPYEKAQHLFSPAERSFLGVLERAVEGQFRVMGKVRLGDLLGTRAGLGHERRMAALNRINRKHVDFVLCEPASLRVVGVIELDDRSHDRPDRKERDRFVDAALGAAGVPVLHLPVRGGYNVAELQRQIAEAFGPK